MSAVEAIVTVGSSGTMEDRIVVSGGLLAVIDGAGSPDPITVDGKSSGAFAAQWVADRLTASPPGSDLRDYVLTANEEFAGALRERNVDPAMKASAPAASLVVMVRRGDGADLVQVGDCLAGSSKDQDRISLFAMQQAMWDRRMQEELDALREQGTSEEDVARREQELNRRSREQMNVAGGYGTFAGDPGVASFVTTAQLDAVTTVVLASDGLTDWLRCDPDTALHRALRANPLLSVLDPERVPRGRDDLSVIRLGRAMT